MANKKEANSTCIICGQKYHLCVACERKHANWKPWRMFVDKENCYSIYKILNDYKFGKITKTEAKSLLATVDLSQLDSFKENIKNNIKEIMKTKRTSRLVKQKEIEVIENEKIEDDDLEKSVEDIGSVENNISTDLN